MNWLHWLDVHEQSEPYSFSCSPGGVQQSKRKQRRKVSSQRQAGLLGCSVFGLFHCIQTRITIQLIEANNEKQIHVDPKWGHTETLVTTIHRNILEWLLNCCCCFFFVLWFWVSGLPYPIYQDFGEHLLAIKPDVFWYHRFHWWRARTAWGNWGSPLWQLYFSLCEKRSLYWDGCYK